METANSNLNKLIGSNGFEQDNPDVRQQVVTKEYIAWLKEFTNDHIFWAESGYGIEEYDGVDPENLQLVLDFIELTLEYFKSQNIDTRKKNSSYNTSEVEVVIGDTILIAERSLGQDDSDVLYQLYTRLGYNEPDRPRVDVAEIVESVIN